MKRGFEFGFGGWPSFLLSVLCCVTTLTCESQHTRPMYLLLSSLLLQQLFPRVFYEAFLHIISHIKYSWTSSSSSSPPPSSPSSPSSSLLLKSAPTTGLLLMLVAISLVSLVVSVLVNTSRMMPRPPLTAVKVPVLTRTTGRRLLHTRGGGKRKPLLLLLLCLFCNEPLRSLLRVFVRQCVSRSAHLFFSQSHH